MFRRMLLVFAFAALALGAQPNELFESRIRPLFANNCFSCHTKSRLGGLEISSRAALIHGGNSGPAIVPGSPDQSLLVQALRQTHERLKMPPAGKLSTEQIKDVEAWIAAGAPWPDPKATLATGKTAVISPEQRNFWSFRPVAKPSVPHLKNPAWVKSPIDAFVLSKLEAANLHPVGPADKRTLIRRATLDLHGVPPTPREVQDFVRDDSPDAFAKVIDRLLSSPRYGERWGRYWLDIARYSDDQLNATQDVPLPNAFRYRDWVVQAFQKDMPYDQFVKAQIAGDLLENGKQDLEAGLGFYALSPSPEFHEDRVDATARGFLGLTVACAQCHDHKYDPIPTLDYYALLGVFENTEDNEVPLAPPKVVAEYKAAKKELDRQEAALKKFLDTERRQLTTMLATQTARYMSAACRVLGPEAQSPDSVSSQESLDAGVLNHWIKYLKAPAEPREHPFLKTWDELIAKRGSISECNAAARSFEREFLQTLATKQEIDEKNAPILNDRSKEQEVLSLPRDLFMLVRDLTEAPPKKKPGARGVLYLSDDEVIGRLSGLWKEHIDSQKANVAELKAKLPHEYPYLRAIKDKDKPANIHVYIGGDKENPGAEAPRHFLTILSEGEPSLFTKGSGRLELANAIADARNPLTARVMVNRIWEHHFGAGIVRTPGNFGQLGERPTNPELLDYLAARFVENHWSMKAMHREMMLTATYALASDNSEQNHLADPSNRLSWRANIRRLDVEALRDSLLFVSGQLNSEVGGPPVSISDPGNKRRTLYSAISRRHLDPLMRLFDFPDPNSTSDERIATNVPVQQLFFLNSDFVTKQAESFTKSLSGTNDDKIRQAYDILFGRDPSAEELRLGVEYLRDAPWPDYARVLLSSNEFCFVR